MLIVDGLELPDGAWWDWEVMSWSDGDLRLAASSDLTYHHGLELVFVAASYVACPASFHHPVFRRPTAREWDEVRRRVGESPPLLVAFDIDGTEDEPAPCLIAADRVEVVTGTAYRYRRDDLRPGERWAAGVWPPAD